MPHRPMEGVRVLEVAQWTFVPSAGAVLDRTGAPTSSRSSTRSRATRSAASRAWGSPWSTTGAVQPDREHANHGKRSVGLALEHPGALEVLYEIARTSDVFLTNFLPEARRRLKIDVPDIRAVNPGIVYVRGSAHGAHGPDAELGGYDNCTYWSRSGAAVGVTPPGTDGLCYMPGPAFGDATGGTTIAGGIAAALFARERTGEPSVLDVSLLSTGVWANSLAIDISLVSGEPWLWPSIDRPGALVEPPRRAVPHLRQPVSRAQHDAARAVLGRRVPSRRSRRPRRRPALRERREDHGQLGGRRRDPPGRDPQAAVRRVDRAVPHARRTVVARTELGGGGSRRRRCARRG